MIPVSRSPFRPWLAAVALALALFQPVAASAAEDGAWALVPERSNVAFFSVKNGTIGERHRFTSVSGRVGPAGEARVVIDLASVETAIPIRNERMREFLFEVGRYPRATVTADIDPDRVGEIDLTGELELHGQTAPISTRVLVSRTQDGEVVVSSLDPVVVTAADFGLAEGVTRLMEIAGLKAIASAVPVSFVLVFEPVQELAAR